MSVVEVRRSAGKWTVWYPDPGWQPCSCDACRTKSQERPMIQAGGKPKTQEEAAEYARYLAPGAEIKIVRPLSRAQILERANKARRPVESKDARRRREAHEKYLADQGKRG